MRSRLPSLASKTFGSLLYCLPQVLYEDDHELSLPEGVDRLLHALGVSPSCFD